jgi:putative oxidoreductase
VDSLISLTNSLPQWQWITVLLARLSVGLLFALSGEGKLFVPVRREKMRETIRRAGLPVPELSAVIVSSIEFAFGSLLVIGCLTPLCCLMLSGNMVGALWTTILPRVKKESLAAWLGDVLYLPEVLYIVILAWLFFSGPGWLSVDHLMFASSGP